MSGKHKKKKRNRPGVKSGKPGISLCMIVKNEQETLPGAVESVKPIVSEIIVVDTGSTDGTEAVAIEMGAQVVSHRWKDDFSAARNIYLKHATQNWILVIDADEALNPVDLQRITALCRDTEIKACEFLTRNYIHETNWSNWVPNDGLYPPASEYSGWYPSYKVRLFRNHEKVKYSGEVHELIEPSLDDLGWPITRVDVPIHHFSQREPERQRKKKILYRECALKKILKSPHDAKAFYEFGVHSSETGEYSQAIQSFNQALGLVPDFGAHYPGLTNIYGYLAGCLIKLSQYEKALMRIEEGLGHDPHNCDLFHLKGIAFIGLGRVDEAVSSLQRAVEINPRFSKGYEALGIAYSRAGDNGNGADALRTALELNPRLTEASQVLESISERGVESAAGENIEKGRETAGDQNPESDDKHLKLSICIIARNEEEDLPGCLDSIKGVADEIVVVDTGSTDGTTELAREMGAKVFHFKWCDDFSAARNESIRHAGGDYILWMDADDRISPQDAEKLRMLKESLPSEKNVAYHLLLHNQKEGLEGDICYQLRLFPNLPGISFEGKIHEQVVYSLERLGVEQRQAEIKVLHTGYRQPSKMKAKIRRNIELLLKQDDWGPDDFVTNFTLAGSYNFIGETDLALERMERAVYGDNDHRRSRFWHLAAHVQLGWMHMTSGDTERALEVFREVLSRDPSNGLARYFMAEIDYYRGNYAESLKGFGSLSDDDFQATYLALPLEKIRYFLRFYRGRCHEELCGHDQAVQEYEEAVKIDGDFPDARKHLGAVYLKQGRYGEAENILFHPSMMDIPDAGVSTNLGLIYARRGNLSEAERMYCRALELDAGMVAARINLGHLLLKQERFGEARIQLEKAGAGASVDVALGLALAMVGEGDIENCVNQCNNLLGLLDLPSNHLLNSVADLGDLYLLIGRKLGDLGQLAKAALALNVAELLNPQSLEILKYTLTVYRQMGEYQKALDYCEKALSLSPSDGKIFSIMEDCYTGMGVTDAARLCRQKSEELAPAPG